MSEAWVYLLRCTDGSLYTGWTIDLERRLARHRAGTASRYTASRLPVQLAHAIPMPDRTAARREEPRIKRLPLTSSRCSAPLRREERPALGPDGRTHKRRRRRPSPPAPDGWHTAGRYHADAQVSSRGAVV